jgi:hypothetical protein
MNPGPFIRRTLFVNIKARSWLGFLMVRHERGLRGSWLVGGGREAKIDEGAAEWQVFKCEKLWE